MNTPSSDGIAAFGNLSPVVDVDVFADETIDLAPPAMPLSSQLANTEDGTIVPATGSVGSPAAGSLYRPGNDSDRLTESQLRQLLEYRNARITDRISEAERQCLSDSSLRQEMERQADDSRSTRGTTSYLERELTDDQLLQELERRHSHKELDQHLRVDTVDLTSRQPPDRTTVGSDRRCLSVFLSTILVL